MKKRTQLQLVAFILGVGATFGGIAFANDKVTVQASETPVFAMETGAAVRTTPDTSGIRWITNVSESWYNANVPATASDVEFGTFVTSANNVEAVTELNENFTTEKRDIPCTETADFTSGTFTYYSAITYTNLDEAQKKAAYAAELIARSYVKYKEENSDEYTYKFASAKDTARCIRSVALAAIEDEEEFAKLPTDADRNAVKAYVGNSEAQVTMDTYYQTAVDTVNGDYTVAYVGTKKVGTFLDGTLTLDKAYLGEMLALTFFDVDGNYAKATESQYITKLVTNDSFATDLKGTAKGDTLAGYFLLTEDITLSEKWTSYVTFSGTLDGNGKTISGLNVGYSNSGSGHSGGLFYQIAGATVKNVAIVDATLSYTAGVLTGRNEAGTLTVDNVYVSLAPQAFSESGDGTVVDNAHRYKGGLVYNNRLDASEIVVKNSIVYMPETLVKLSGLVAARQQNTGSVTVENSMLIGGNGAIVGINNSTGTFSGEECVTDAVSAHKKINAKDASSLSTAEKAYQANHPYVELAPADFATRITTLTNEIVVLTDDVTVSDAYYGIENTFSGVFDGQEHTISGLNVKSANNAYHGGLFKYLAGSIKNLHLVGTLGNNKNTGLIADMAKGSAYVENVYVAVRCNASNGAPLFRTTAAANTSVSVKDVVTENTFSTVAKAVSMIMLTATKPSTIITENCYWLSPYADTVSMNGAAEDNTKNNVTISEAASYFFYEGCGTVGYSGENYLDNFKAAFNAEGSTMYLTEFICGKFGLTYRGKSQA